FQAEDGIRDRNVTGVQTCALPILLNKTRGDKPNWYSWIEFFIDASERMAKKLNSLLDNANKLAEEGISQCSSSTERYIYLLTFSIPNITAVEAAQQVKVA